METRETRKVEYPESSMIPEMSDSEFLSFLYSERNRENDISQYQGWNTWVLIGAAITALCAFYSTIKTGSELNYVSAFYYAVGTIAFFLAYHNISRLFKRERGHVISRVYLLKDVIPFTDSGLSIVTALCILAIIPVIGCTSAAYWCWLIVLLVETAVLIVGLYNRDRIVPYYFHRTYFPEPRWNMIYSGLSCGLFCEAGQLSFKAASGIILCPEFEAGVCIAVFIILIYLILRINVDNKVVKTFDSIMDMYLYAGATKEQTYQKILCNRMGYGVIEICQKKLNEVQDHTKKCEGMSKEVAQIKQTILSGQVDRNLFHSSTLRMKQILNYLKETLRQSEKLSGKLDEILKVVPVFTSISDINAIFDTNKELYEKIQIVDGELDELSDLIRDRFTRHYCRKTNSLCEALDCDARNDSMCWNYALERRWNSLLIWLGIKK